jgi:hypothetical protein
MPLTIHKEHFQGLVDKNKTLRAILKESAKFRLNGIGVWLVVEAVPWDADMVYCYNEVTFEQYSIPFRNIDKDMLVTIPKE